MARPASTPFYAYFSITYPLEYVAHVEINRPDRLNAFIEPMWHELRSLFTHLSHAPSVRAIVLSGAGPRAFTTGLDVLAASSTGMLSARASPAADPARVAIAIRRHVLEFQDCVGAIERCEKPVVCALHGYGLGLGVDIAVCADVRLCAADARLAVKEVDVGLAADVGTLSRLGKVVGSGSWVKEVCLTGREFGAEEALRVGFVGAVVAEGKEALVAEAVRIAGVMAAKSPVAVQGTKELLNWSRDHGVADGLRYTGVWNSAMLQSEDVAAAVMAGLKKKTAKFEKL